MHCPDWMLVILERLSIGTVSNIVIKIQTVQGSNTN